MVNNKPLREHEANIIWTKNAEFIYKWVYAVIPSSFTVQQRRVGEKKQQQCETRPYIDISVVISFGKGSKSTSKVNL